MFAQLERDARRLRRLVYDVHRLTEAQRPALFIDKCPIALDDLVRDRVAGHTEPFRARSISLTHALAPARVAGDPERLAQVLDNLLSNALRYTDPGGRVVVSLVVRDGEAVIDVADSGVGIAREYLARVFDRFWRAPGARARAAEGSGVGLALVSELVRAHGGAVEVSSRPGQGTSFWVPASPRRRTHRAAPSTSELAPGSAGREPLRSRGGAGSRSPAKPHGALVDAISRGRDAALDRRRPERRRGSRRRRRRALTAVPPASLSRASREPRRRHRPRGCVMRGGGPVAERVRFLAEHGWIARMIAVFADSSCESRRGFMACRDAPPRERSGGVLGGRSNRGRAHHAHSPPRTAAFAITVLGSARSIGPSPSSPRCSSSRSSRRSACPPSDRGRRRRRSRRRAPASRSTPAI